MRLEFPKDFRFGTSTAAAQIETAGDHNWKNLKAIDNSIFHRTTDHEFLWKSDIELIAGLAPNYRMSFMWSKLQKYPFAELDEHQVIFYKNILTNLKNRNVDIMLVLHHFENPLWFEASGGWGSKESIKYWNDYILKIAKAFGQNVTLWNTFNEPNLYISLSSLAGLFPPKLKNPIHALKVLKNIKKAHESAYHRIHELYPNAQVGISHNSAVFEPDNIWGSIPAKITDLWYMDYLADQFSLSDFVGLSYYARIGYDPFPVTYLDNPNKFKSNNKLHDDMWEYYPDGITKCIERYWNKYKKPIIITENGVCTDNDQFRKQAIKDYLFRIHGLIQKGVDIKGYYHWSAWDNFEWHLGNTFKFGLYGCHPETKERIRKPSADLYSKVAHSGKMELTDL